MAKRKNQESIIKELARLLHTLSELLNEMVELAALEFRLAVRGVFLITGLFIAAVFFFISAWFLFLAAVAGLLVVFLQMSWVSAFGLLALANLLLIIPVLMWIKKARKRLTFPATRRQLHSYGGVHHEKTVNEKTYEKD